MSITATEKGEFKNVTPKLEPLSCVSCGTIVQLTNSETTTCQSCANIVPISESYRKLKQDQIKKQEIIKKGNDVYLKLSKPPSSLMNIWYNIASTVAETLGCLFTILAMLGVGYVLVMLFVTYFAVLAITPFVQENYNDTWGAENIYAMLGAGFTFLIVLPLVLNSMVKQFGDLKRILQASLSAKPSFIKSGEYQCRCCGSSIPVKSDDICVSCEYCEAENLVSVPESWLQKIQNFSKWHFKTINEALTLKKTYTNELKTNLKYWVVGSIAFVVFAWLFGNFVSWVDTENMSPPNWAQLSKQPKLFIPDQFKPNDAPIIQLNTEQELKTNNYWVGLQYREKLKITVKNQSENMFINIKNTTTFGDDKIYDNLELTPSTHGNLTATYTAPYTGKFMLEFGNYKKSKVQFEIVK